MMLDVGHELSLWVQQAGYTIIAWERPRPSRLVALLEDRAGVRVVLLVQQRLLIQASDVQDLADLVQIRRAARGILWSLSGRFSAQAQRTQEELGKTHLLLATELPLA